ncbi:TGB 2 protein [Euonymus yellow vein virus]|uniref:TGB 2 protein n=1 Tax=Euonymus yellow vein virus TaxID=2013968 RepID=A0A218MK54_9VIRU|nr:TGB 2 protein [Euonymus yellow vein virus]ASE06182.1 TGB 2 protein [Euonymus yellow vein virus]
MPLTPPRDYSTVFVVALAAFSLVAFTFTATRSTLPFVGDNIHSLAHGGCYRDGTKSIQYFPPTPVGSALKGGYLAAAITCIVIPGVLYAVHRSNLHCKPVPCPNCRTHVASPQ